MVNTAAYCVLNFSFEYYCSYGIMPILYCSGMGGILFLGRAYFVGYWVVTQAVIWAVAK